MFCILLQTLIGWVLCQRDKSKRWSLTVWLKFARVHSEFLVGVRVARSVIFYVVFWKSLFVLFLLVIVLLSVLRFTSPNYPFVIFNPLLSSTLCYIQPFVIFNPLVSSNFSNSDYRFSHKCMLMTTVSF